MYLKGDNVSQQYIPHNDWNLLVLIGTTIGQIERCYINDAVAWNQGMLVRADRE
jgi:hypothetical protein